MIVITHHRAETRIFNREQYMQKRSTRILLAALVVAVGAANCPGQTEPFSSSADSTAASGATGSTMPSIGDIVNVIDKASSPTGPDGKAGGTDTGMCDVIYWSQSEGSLLFRMARSWSIGRHAAYRSGRRFGESSERIHVGGPDEGYLIGYFAFGSGRDKIIVDRLGLTDPLLARLASSRPDQWRAGHVERPIPAGYLDSLRADRNLIQDPEVYRYYEKIRTVTRGPLFTLDRWKAIVELNLAREPLRCAEPGSEPE